MSETMNSRHSPTATDCKEFAFFTHLISCHLKWVLMMLTLISFCSGILFSCSLPTVDGAVAANSHLKSALQVMHHQILYDQQSQHQPPQPQANDIFTALTHSQGRINEHIINHLDDDDDKENRAARVGSASNTEATNLHEESSPSKPVQSNKKRNAFSAAQIKAEKARKQAAQHTTTGVTCSDEEGNSVAWFIAYKLPQISTSQDPLVQQGSKYYFLTANKKDSWTESAHPLNSDKSILAATLQILWRNDSTSNIARLAYNDQPPSHPAVVKDGHTKGVVWTSANEGVWLQHSCPHFPDLAADNFSSSYPHGGLINGQMFLCMSLGNVSLVDVVGSVLQYTRPFVYNYSIPTSMQNLIPELTKVAEKNATVRKAPWFNTFSLEAGDFQLKVHAKGPKFRREIYSTWIAPEYGTGLDVQSWLNGAHPYMSNCTTSQFSVWNVLLKNLTSQKFSNTDDHSKWAVSTDKEKPVTCIGDLNRMKPQRTRGGVAVCVTDLQVWSAFKSMVDKVQPCNSTSLKPYIILRLWSKQK